MTRARLDPKHPLHAWRFKPETRSNSGLTGVDVTGEDNVYFLVGSRRLTTSVFAKDRVGVWHYAGMFYEDNGKQVFTAH